jgi:hypothetical protein
MVFQDRLVVIEDGQGRAGLDVKVVGGSCVGLKLKKDFLHFLENARNFGFERKTSEFQLRKSPKVSPEKQNFLQKWKA